MCDVGVRRQTLLLVTFLATLARSEEPVRWVAQAAEKEGRIAQAWALYSQAAALDPGDRKLAAKVAALRPAALEQARITVNLPANGEAETPLDPSIVRPLTPEEVREMRTLAPPPEVTLPKNRRKFALNGSPRTIWPQLLDQCSLKHIFDSEFNVATIVRVELDDADCFEAIHAVETMTGTFLVPLADTMVMIVRDTPEKRRDQERTVAIGIPLIEPITAQEAQEMARSVQLIYEIQRFAIDPTRRVALFRDRWSKVRLARALFEQLSTRRPEIQVDVELLEVNETSDVSYGLSLQNLTQLVNFGRVLRSSPQLMPQFRNFATFGGGMSLFGFGITSAQLFATATRNVAQTLVRSQIRTLDGTSASLHIGDRFPIITAQFLGDSTSQPGNATVVRPPPQIQFEELGLTLKLTPRSHGEDEVTLAVESEFKVLTGQANNGIPVISNRKFNGQVRLREGEWAVVAGIVTQNDSRTYSGIAGAAQVPGLRQATGNSGRARTRGQTLLVLKPRIIDPGPATFGTRPIWSGSEGRALPGI